MAKAPEGKQRFWSLLREDVNPKHADLLLFSCCLCSGLADSTIYNGKYHRTTEYLVHQLSILAYNTFVSMQTGMFSTSPQIYELSSPNQTKPGNTIFVGLGASNQNSRPYGWARSLTSIGSFIIGSFLFAHLSRTLGARRRGSLIFSFLLQATMLITTASLVQTGVIAGITLHPNTSEPQWSQEVPIVLVSIQSAGQIVASRALGYNEIPTVVITSLLCDLMSDPQLFLARNVKRDRRVVAFSLTLVGAIVGGWVTKGTGDIHVCLWMVAGIKLGISGAWVFWREDLG
jgi:hypothetical protein